MDRDPFKEYIMQSEPEKRYKRRTVEMQEKGFIARENGKRNGRWVVKISD